MSEKEVLFYEIVLTEPQENQGQNIFVDICEDTRLSLIQFYNSKTTFHLECLFAAILAFIGFNVADLISFLKIPILLYLIYASFIYALVYFLGRAYYWTLYSTATYYIRAYSNDHQEKVFKGENENQKKPDHLQFNVIKGVSDSIADYYLHRKYYETEHIGKKNCVFVFFRSKWRFYLGPILVGVAVLVLSLFHIFILKESLF